MTATHDHDDARHLEFLPNDGPLRENVRTLGAMVGRMLAEQGGEAFFERVESVRLAAIRRRESGAGISGMAGRLAGLSADDAEALARAFATYFQMVNVAERVHRIRRRRDYQLAGAAAQPESLADVLGQLKQRGVDAEELLAWIGKLDVEPVFTAHPTEAVRASLLEKEEAIVKALIAEFDAHRPPPEREADAARMQMALTAGWQTAEASPVRPSVQDEFDHVGYYLTGSLYRVLPVFYEALERELKNVYGIEPELPRLLRFASWVGGDMDGNPNVGADTISETLRAQRAMVLERYIGECAHLQRALSQTEDRVEVSAGLRERLAQYTDEFLEDAMAIRPRHRDMPYRCLLTLMRARLEATLEDADNGYPNAEAFEADVALIAESLAAHKGEHAGLFAVQRLLRRVRTFGFHLARLDVRQDSRVHDDALAALLGDAGWSERPKAERAERLRALAAGDESFGDNDDETAERLRAVFATLADARQRYGVTATGPYIISMAESAADVLAVLALARHGGLVDDEGRVPLDVAPLFETVDDLTNGPDTLRALLADPVYRAHLAARGDRQLIMLGYSDSGKDGGILAARWGLQRAQVELLEVAEQAGIELTFFHGRGGSASRGGSRVTPALMASPRGSVGGRLRMTEQGEVIHRKYGIRALALRNLEQTVGAALHASLRPRDPDEREDLWRERMVTLAAWGREAYRELVGDEQFVPYFRTATPIDVIERMTLGSRPSRRRSMRGVEDLRAIPWVFSWTQCRAIMPGWFGLGSALERGIEAYGFEAMAEMARDWPFLSTLLDDVEMVLAKADLDIAEAFSELSGELHEHFFPRIRGEFERTRDVVLRLKHNEALLTDDKRLSLSIRLRNPYVDPMSLLQVDLLKRWRAEGSEDGALLRALVACVNGVSQGLQNTG
ncbi:phosphoenolpyruvate carboxylase [Oleiagrimonas soli]|uniref:Phosphoenolpyruvate carboxylase n=1 Tax=Oleiagrimonas soli TaxID=1543381 RepID=A0A099CU29_9GAMM|nr:phosphoenolpyruvate carboxylase [Oleiagrimonas soli]KGI77112.1 phosphoenolpyruvate carboxylase [Oleiagrimonas soli]MBB6185351.1 phosphoenolpyruvate carboxylase [Oleiagrimonas soli]